MWKVFHENLKIVNLHKKLAVGDNNLKIYKIIACVVWLKFRHYIFMYKKSKIDKSYKNNLKNINYKYNICIVNFC